MRPTDSSRPKAVASKTRPLDGPVGQVWPSIRDEILGSKFLCSKRVLPEGVKVLRKNVEEHLKT